MFRVTFFQDDDVTPLLGTVDGSGNVTDPSFSSDPAHARPYLEYITEYDEAEINLVEGSAVIGQVNFVIVDKRRTAADQDTGILTFYMSDANGETALIGHRVLVEVRRSDGVWVLLQNSVVTFVELQEDLVTYRIGAKDIRERGNQPIFTKAGPIAVLPKGPIDGYGKLPAGGVNTYLVPPAGYIRGIYKSITANHGLVVLDRAELNLDDEIWLTGVPSTQFDASGNNVGQPYYKDVILKWYPAAGGATKTITNPPYYPDGRPAQIVSTYEILGLGAIGAALTWVRLSSTVSGDLPTNNQQVMLQVQMNSTMEPSDSRPIYLENLTYGQILKNAYDGVYSDTAPKVLYNTTVMADLVANTPIARGIVVERSDNMNEWLQENVYKPLGMAPALDDTGKVSPIKYELPPNGVTLLQLDGANSRSAKWKHDGEAAINEVHFNYKRDYYQETYNSVGSGGSGRDRAEAKKNAANPTAIINEVDVKHIVKHTSVGLIGPKIVEYNPVTVRALSAYIAGTTITGDISDETGTKLALARGRQVLDRFAMGAQRFTIEASRSDSGVSAAKVGDWVMVAHAWLPNYATRERNANRLAQIVKTKDIDPKWREFECEDAGTALTPLGTPTTSVALSGLVGAVTVSAVAAGSEARIDYAIVANGSPAPSSTSGLWTYMARGGVGVYNSPPLPTNKTIHFRARGEAVGRRPSSWVVTGSITVASAIYAPFSVMVTIDHLTGVPRVTWQRPSAAVNGVRIHYAIHDPDDVNPSMVSSVDVSATDLAKDLTGIYVSAGAALTVELESWSGWTGAAVSGTASADRTRRTVFGTMPRVLPTINFVNVIPRFNGGQIVGWNVSGTVDGATLSIKAVLTTGLTFTAGQPNTVVTDTSKFFSFDLDQSAGGDGKITLTPYTNVAATLIPGSPLERVLSRPPITTHALQRVSRTEHELTLRANPSTSTTKFRHYLDGETPPAFSTYTGKTRLPVAEDADRIVEFYSEIAGGYTTLLIEEVHTLVLDTDHKPRAEFGAVQALVSDPNMVQMSFEVDDDCASFDLYMRLGAWPTYDGTNTDLTNTLNPWYKKQSFDSQVPSHTTFMTTGTWYLVLVGRDFNGFGGDAYGTSIVVSGSAPTGAQLMNLIATETLVGGGPSRQTHLEWDYTAAIDTDYTAGTPRYKVRIYEAINTGDWVELVGAGADRRAAQDHDGTNTVTLKGSYRTAAYTGCTKGTTGCSLSTLYYKVELWDTIAATKIATYFDQREAYVTVLL